MKVARAKKTKKKPFNFIDEETSRSLALSEHNFDTFFPHFFLSFRQSNNQLRASISPPRKISRSEKFNFCLLLLLLCAFFFLLLVERVAALCVRECVD